MKTIKWKILLITCLVTLSPILLGIYLYDALPAEVPIHFNIHNQPDNFASKNFAVFGIPALMVLLQLICCIINDIKSAQHGERKKLELVTKWIIPVMSIVLQSVTFAYALGQFTEIHRAAALIVAIIFLLMGNYLPKFGETKNSGEDMEKTVKINRMIGRASILMGVLFLISVFLPPIAALICVALLIPYGIFCTVYGVKVGRK